MRTVALFSLRLLGFARHGSDLRHCRAWRISVQYVIDRSLLSERCGEYRGRTDDLLHAMQAL